MFHGVQAYLVKTRGVLAQAVLSVEGQGCLGRQKTKLTRFLGDASRLKIGDASRLKIGKRRGPGLKGEGEGGLLSRAWI